MSNSFTGGADWDVWVLKLDSGGVISWQMAYQTTADVSHVQKGVVDRIFAVRDLREPAWTSIFHDGFESGDTGQWSATVP